MQLNESDDIPILDCTNIDLSQLEQLYFRMDLYDVIADTYEGIEKTILNGNVTSNPIHYCTWMHTRINGSCMDGHLATLNSKLCNGTTAFDCSAKICNQL